MKHVVVCKCDPTGQAETEDTIIGISAPLPRVRNDQPLSIYTDLYEGEALKIADALQGALPQGTLDRLLRILLGRAATYYRVKAGS